MSPKPHAGRPTVSRAPAHAGPSPKLRRLLERSVALENAGDVDAAVEVAGQAATLAPMRYEPSLRLGCALRKAGKLPVAREALEHALRLGPGRADVLFHLAMTCRDLNDLATAASIYEDLLAAIPDLHPALVNYGELRLFEGRCAEAVDLLQRAIALDPTHLASWVNLGAVLGQLGDHETAIACYDQVLALDPANEVARLNRGTLLLVTGDWARGWADYEARFSPLVTPPREPLPGPRWQGEPLDGKTLLVMSEQGFGDHLQFVRYATMLTAQGARVVVECPAAVERLLAGVDGVAATAIRGKPLPPYDYHIPLLSIPGVVGTVEETIPVAIPYLRAPDEAPAQADAIRARIGGPDALRVGVVWAGSPTHRNDRRRSIGVGLLKYVLELPGTRFVSLQKGAGSEQLQLLDDATRARLAEVGPLCDDFSDTAWAIAQLDLVLTVDTSVAHLAGAMGKPVWMIVPVDPDWRWLRERADSPWYPTMRIFRQPAHGDWGSVVLALRAALAEAVEQRGA